MVDKIFYVYNGRLKKLYRNYFGNFNCYKYFYIYLEEWWVI